MTRYSIGHRPNRVPDRSFGFFGIGSSGFPSFFGRSHALRIFLRGFDGFLFGYWFFHTGFLHGFLRGLFNFLHANPLQ